MAEQTPTIKELARASQYINVEAAANCQIAIRAVAVADSPSI